VKTKWLGLYICEACGQVFPSPDSDKHGNTDGSHYHKTESGCFFAGTKLCRGKIVPWERRKTNRRRK
jgi:hypothetical protein